MPGVYGGYIDKFPLGALMEKGLQLKTGQTHVQRYLKELMGLIEEKKLDTTFLISHRLPLERAPEGYANFKSNQNEWDQGGPQAGGLSHGIAHRELAVVTGASTGIGYEFAKIAAQDGYDLVVVADEPQIEEAARKLGQLGTKVEAVQADLATEHGVSALWDRIEDRRVDVLFANAGRGLGGAFLDQDWDRIKHVIDTNVTATVSLTHKVGRQMRGRGAGKILLTGSIAGFIPGAFQAVYNSTKAFVDSFAEALRNELEDTAVTVTCLEPGPTDTPFFERADMMDTSVGQDDSKEDPVKTARTGYDALQSGKGQVASGIMNKIQTVFAGIIPDAVLAQMHRRMAEPGTGDPAGNPNTSGDKAA